MSSISVLPIVASRRTIQLGCYKLHSRWLGNFLAAKLFLALAHCSDGAAVPHKRFAQRSSRRRVVALAAAYVIALSSLIGGFTAARAAAALSNAAGATLCHRDSAGQTAPAGEDHGGKLCTDSCCIGCLMLMAALPPPPAKSAGAPPSSGRRLALPAAVAFASTPQAKFHQSRAPPIDA
jgi:hypothetical protein